jgi:hypothetical protein
MLISRGHRLDDLIRRYTIDQVEHLFMVVVKARKRELLDLSVAVRVAFGADKDQWAKYVDEMSARPKKEEPVRISSKEEMEAFKNWSRNG